MGGDTKMDDVVGKSIRVMFGLVAASAVFFVIVFLAFGGENPAADMIQPPTVQAKEDETTPGTDTHVTDEGELDSWNGQVIATPPTAFDETTEGQVLVRFFRSLSNGQITPEGFRPHPDYEEVVYGRREGASPVPGGMLSFFQRIMTNGSWDVAGRVVSGSVKESARVDQGSAFQPREVFLLIEQDGTWYQIRVTVEFVYLQDGRILLNYNTIAVPEIHRLDEELVPKYLDVYGVNK